MFFWECFFPVRILKFAYQKWNLGMIWLYYFLTSFNPLSTNPTKSSNTLKQFAGFCQRIVWACFTILCVWRLKGYIFIYHRTYKLISGQCWHFIPLENTGKTWFSAFSREYILAVNGLWCKRQLAAGKSSLSI